MVGENKDKPNYRLHYMTLVGDLCNDHSRCDFSAPSNSIAAQEAKRYVDSQGTHWIPTLLVRLERLFYSEDGSLCGALSVPLPID